MLIISCHIFEVEKRQFEGKLDFKKYTTAVHAYCTISNKQHSLQECVQKGQQVLLLHKILFHLFEDTGRAITCQQREGIVCLSVAGICFSLRELDLL